MTAVLVEAWAPSSGNGPLSCFEWCLMALATRLFRPSGRVGLVWERGARVLHLDPLEIVEVRERQLISGYTCCDENRQETGAARR
jgi:hypothetical protein